jgi:hypothetical protein
LALLLENPVEVRTRALAKPTRFAAPVLDTLKVEDLGPLLERNPNGKDVFRWRYNRAGRLIVSPSKVVHAVGVEAKAVADLGRPEAPATPSRPVTSRQIGIIEKINNLIADASDNTVTCGTLSTGFGVISTSPAWPSVLEAIQRFKTNLGEYHQRGEDMFIVNQFFDLLTRSMRTISLALFSGWLLGNLGPRGSGKSDVFAGLQVLSETLSLKSLPEEAVTPRVIAFAKDGLDALGLVEPMWPALTDDQSLQKWESGMDGLVEAAEDSWTKLKPDDFRPDLGTWDFWRGHLGGAPERPDFKTVILAALRKGPSRLLKIPLSEMTARDWSVAFYTAIAMNSPIMRRTEEPPPLLDGTPVPTWLIFVAMERLGFGSRIEQTINAPPEILAGINRARLQEDIRFNISAGPYEVRQGIAIVSREGAESETWKPGKEVAALILRQAELTALPNYREQIPDFLFRWLDIQWLVFDWSGRPSEPGSKRLNISAEIDNARPLTGFSTRMVPVIVPTPAIMPTPWMPILPPPSLDELAARLRGLR